MTLGLFAAIAAVLFLAGFVLGAMGFGFGLIGVGLLSLLVGVKTAVPLVASFATVIQFGLFVRLRGSFALRDALPLIGGAVAGIPVGVWLLRNLDPRPLFLALGIFLLGYVGNATLRTGSPPRLGRGWGAVLGLGSGVLGGAFSTGGPPAVLWVSSQPWQPNQIRATLLGLFSVMAMVQLPMYAANDLLTGDLLLLAVELLPAAALGAWIGARSGERIDSVLFQKLMNAGLVALGAVYIAKGWPSA